MDRKDDEEQEASQKRSNKRKARFQRGRTEDSAITGNDIGTSDPSDSSDKDTVRRKQKGLK